MNQNDNISKEQESLKKERFLGDTEVESRLNYSIQKTEKDLKEDIQKVEKDLKEDIQKVMDSHKGLVKRLWWIAGFSIASILTIVSIVVALITKGN